MFGRHRLVWICTSIMKFPNPVDSRLYKRRNLLSHSVRGEIPWWWNPFFSFRDTPEALPLSVGVGWTTNIMPMITECLQVKKRSRRELTRGGDMFFDFNPLFTEVVAKPEKCLRETDLMERRGCLAYTTTSYRLDIATLAQKKATRATAALGKYEQATRATRRLRRWT